MLVLGIVTLLAGIAHDKLLILKLKAQRSEAYTNLRAMNIVADSYVYENESSLMAAAIASGADYYGSQWIGNFSPGNSFCPPNLFTNGPQFSYGVNAADCSRLKYFYTLDIGAYHTGNPAAPVEIRVLGRARTGYFGWAVGSPSFSSNICLIPVFCFDELVTTDNTVLIISNILDWLP